MESSTFETVQLLKNDIMSLYNFCLYPFNSNWSCNKNIHTSVVSKLDIKLLIAVPAPNTIWLSEFLTLDC